jgi:hypothetical protein
MITFLMTFLIASRPRPEKLKLGNVSVVLANTNRCYHKSSLVAFLQFDVMC